MKAPRDYHTLSQESLDKLPTDCLRVHDGFEMVHVVGPAFFDPQVNGFAGVHFCDPNLNAEQLDFVIDHLARAGCCDFLFTLGTDAPGFLMDQFQRVSDMISRSPRMQGTIPGFHLEGPFLNQSPGYRGGHSAQHLSEPDWELFMRLQKASGDHVRMITLAPELRDSEEFIRACDRWRCLRLPRHSDATRRNC